MVEVIAAVMAWALAFGCQCSAFSPRVLLSVTSLSRSSRNPRPDTEPPVAEYLKLGDLGEVKLANLHRRHHHVERLLAAGAHGNAHGFDIRQHRDQTLIKAKIAQTTLHLSVFNQKSTVARHARHDLLVRIHFADVPQARNQHPALG